MASFRCAASSSSRKDRSRVSISTSLLSSSPMYCFFRCLHSRAVLRERSARVTVSPLPESSEPFPPSAAAAAAAAAAADFFDAVAIADAATVFSMATTSCLAAAYAASVDALLPARLLFRPPVARGETVASVAEGAGVMPFASASRAWILSCFFKLPHCAKALPQVLH